MKATLLLAVAAIGLLQPVQAGMMSTLRESLGNAWLSGIWIVAVELVGFAALFAILQGPVPNWHQIAATPWWAWFGGLLGVIILFAIIAFPDKVGAGPFTGMLVTSGLVASLVLDHYGLFGFEQHAINLWRAMGGLFMIAGVILIAAF